MEWRSPRRHRSAPVSQSSRPGDAGAAREPAGDELRVAFRTKASEYREVGYLRHHIQEVLMSTDVITSILQAHPFTEGFWPDHIARLSAMASQVQFHPGESIFREGDHSSFFYLLIGGNVA